MEPTKASLDFIKRERVMTRNASRVPTKYEALRFNAFKGVDDPRSVQVTEKRQNKTPFSMQSLMPPAVFKYVQACTHSWLILAHKNGLLQYWTVKIGRSFTSSYVESLQNLLEWVFKVHGTSNNLNCWNTDRQSSHPVEQFTSHEDCQFTF